MYEVTFLFHEIIWRYQALFKLHIINLKTLIQEGLIKSWLHGGEVLILLCTEPEHIKTVLFYLLS